MKKIIFLFSTVVLLVVGTSCERGDLSVNPNAAGQDAIINIDLFVNHITVELYNGGGVLDKYSNNQPEGPWTQAMRWNQYFVSNYAYYWGNNYYNWTNTATDYSVLKYAVLMQEQIDKQGVTVVNADAYKALVKFFKAYSFIWYTQRVGDIPMLEAGDPTNLTPKFDSQKDVYTNCLAMLDDANTLMGGYILSSGKAGTIASAGDIYGLTNLQWQKVINTFKLRVLLSLSKRADDNLDMDIKGQFNKIVSDPATYPIMTSTADNIVYKYNTAFNPYPIKANGNTPYSVYANISTTYLNLTTAAADPRTFIAATPAPAQIVAGKAASDFTAYVGADINLPQTTLNADAGNGVYSFTNYRYYASADGSTCEPYIIMGYAELCFNIAEAINRGWTGGTAATWYTNGINASLSLYGLTNGQVLKIYDRTGGGTTQTPLGTATVDIPTFMANVAYKGDNLAGLQQILEQKYVAMFQNTGWEAFYNWRRTGFPAFSEGGSGIGTGNNMIQRRWLYDNNEITANANNYAAAIQSQFGGTDDVTKDIWAVK